MNAEDWVPETREKFRCEYEVKGRCCRARATWRVNNYLVHPDLAPAWLCDQHRNELLAKELEPA